MLRAYRIIWRSDDTHGVVGYDFWSSPEAASNFISDFYRPPKSEELTWDRFGEGAHPQHSIGGVVVHRVGVSNHGLIAHATDT